MGVSVSNLSERKELAALFLGLGCDYIQTSALIGIHRATLWRWRKDAAFEKLVLAHKLNFTIQELQRIEPDMDSGEVRKALVAAKKTLRLLDKANIIVCRLDALNKKN